MNQISLFIDLTRLKKPIGFFLLFWPCAWSLTLAFDFTKDLSSYFFYLSFFFLGSILMRSAGCVINDIVDKKFDKKVLRTKERPVASGKISILLAIFYSLLICLFAFLILINFNRLTIYLALASMPLAFTYPFMKRITYWPQLFLGITFNYGIILGWTAINPYFELSIFILYFGAIFWTLGYDTIYGFQDIKDDEIIGLKSTSIKFKKNPIIFLNFSYLVFFISILATGVLMNFEYMFYFFLLIIFYQLFFVQLSKFKKNNPAICLSIFKSNNLLGFIVYINILIGKLI